jgi:acetyl-CoA acyltransferase
MIIFLHASARTRCVHCRGGAQPGWPRTYPRKAVFRDVHPADLLGRTYAGLIQRSGIEAAQVDNVITGCVYQIAEQSAGIAPSGVASDGPPQTTGATTLDI